MEDGLLLPFAMFGFVGLMGRLLINIVTVRRTARRRRHVSGLTTRPAI